MMRWDIKRAELTVKQHVNSSDAAKRCVARIAKYRYGELKERCRMYRRSSSTRNAKKWLPKSLMKGLKN